MKFTVWLTNDCNLKCTYCYERNNKKQDKMLPDTASQVVDFILKQMQKRKINDCIIIDFLGGEPLLNYEIMHFIIEKIKSQETVYPILMRTTTNAVLLTEDKSRYLMNALDEISVSIDGNEQTHNTHRKCCDGTGSYMSIIENIRNLLSYEGASCNLRARMTITPTTAKYLFDNVSYLVSLGFKTIVPVIDLFSNWSEIETELLYQEVAKIYEGFVVTGNDLRIGLVDDVSLRQESLCLAGEETMHIGSDGTIYPCSYVMGQEEFIFGDIRKGVIQEKIAWLKCINNSKMVDSCMQCAWRSLCKGNRCRLLNYAVTGDFDTPPAAMCVDEHLHLRISKQYYQKKALGRES